MPTGIVPMWARPTSPAYKREPARVFYQPIPGQPLVGGHRFRGGLHGRVRMVMLPVGHWSFA
jgi:hypothetical protein